MGETRNVRIYKEINGCGMCPHLVREPGSIEWIYYCKEAPEKFNEERVDASELPKIGFPAWCPIPPKEK